MLLKKEKTAIDNFLIKDDILYYEYSKKISSYQGVKLKTLLDLQTIFKKVQISSVKTYLSPIFNLNPSKLIIFFQIDGRSKKQVFRGHSEIKTILMSNIKNDDLCFLKEKELEKNFFLQIDDFQVLSRNCQIAYGDSTFTLFNQKNSKKISFAQFQFTSINFSNSNIKYFLDFLESLHIDAFLTFKFSHKLKMIPILIVKTFDSESIQKLTQMIQSHEIEMPLKKKEFNIDTFLNIIKKIPIQFRKLRRFDKMLHCLSKIENSFINYDFNMNQSNFSIQNGNRESLLHLAKEILVSAQIQFSQEDEEEICIPSLQSVILLQKKLNLKKISEFLLKFYPNKRKLIIIQEKICDFDNLKNNTNLFKLEKIELIPKSEINVNLIQKCHQSKIPLIG